MGEDCGCDVGNGIDHLEPELGPEALGVALEAGALDAGADVLVHLAHVDGTAGQLAVEAERDGRLGVVTPHRTHAPRPRSTSGTGVTAR